MKVSIPNKVDPCMTSMPWISMQIIRNTVVVAGIGTLTRETREIICMDLIMPHKCSSEPPMSKLRKMLPLVSTCTPV